MLRARLSEAPLTRERLAQVKETLNARHEAEDND